MKPGDAKFLCRKCGIRGISAERGPAPSCHICKDGTLLVRVDEPEYSHGILNNVVASNWNGATGNIKQTLIDVTKKIQEIRGRYDHYTHIHMTEAAWKFTKASGTVFKELTPESTLYGLPFNVFPTIVELFAHQSSPRDKILAVDYVDDKLVQLNL